MGSSCTETIGLVTTAVCRCADCSGVKFAKVRPLKTSFRAIIYLIPRMGPTVCLKPCVWESKSFPVQQYHNLTPRVKCYRLPFGNHILCLCRLAELAIHSLMGSLHLRIFHVIMLVPTPLIRTRPPSPQARGNLGLLLNENAFLAVVVTEVMLVVGDFVAAGDEMDDMFVAHCDGCEQFEGYCASASEKGSCVSV